MFCYGADNLLAQFFRAIELDDNIPRINIYEKNWFYDDVVILWWQAIEWNLWEGRISTKYEYDIVWEDKEGGEGYGRGDTGVVSGGYR